MALALCGSVEFLAVNVGCLAQRLRPVRYHQLPQSWVLRRAANCVVKRTAWRCFNVSGCFIAAQPLTTALERMSGSVFLVVGLHASRSLAAFSRAARLSEHLAFVPRRTHLRAGFVFALGEHQSLQGCAFR